MNRYLVLIHFASKAARTADEAQLMIRVRDAVRSGLQECEAVLTSPAALAFCGLSALSPEELWSAMRVPLASQDNLSIIELGREIVTTHPGLTSWQARTRWMKAPGRS